MRAFFCIPIPNQLQRTILEIAEYLRSQTEMRANWVPRHNYHITLQFLGDIDPGLSVNLDELCRDVCNNLTPFECMMDRASAFPNVDRARVIWTGGEAPPSLRRLSQALSEGLLDLRFPEARKEPLVHVTLARIKGRPDPALPGLISELNPIAPLKMTVDRIVLMESMLKPQGVEYSPLCSTRLGGSKG